MMNKLQYIIELKQCHIMLQNVELTTKFIRFWHSLQRNDSFSRKKLFFRPLWLFKPIEWNKGAFCFAFKETNIFFAEKSFQFSVLGKSMLNVSLFPYIFKVLGLKGPGSTKRLWRSKAAFLNRRDMRCFWKFESY